MQHGNNAVIQVPWRWKYQRDLNFSWRMIISADFLHRKPWFWNPLITHSFQWIRIPKYSRHNDGVFAYSFTTKKHVMTIGLNMEKGVYWSNKSNNNRTGTRYLYKLPNNRIEFVIGLFVKISPVISFTLLMEIVLWKTISITSEPLTWRDGTLQKLSRSN